MSIDTDMARLNITYQGFNGDLSQLVPDDSTDTEVREMATEVVRNEGIGGDSPHPDADFSHFAVERFPPKDGESNPVIMVRPKVPLG
jgi:hypothetical protein